MASSCTLYTSTLYTAIAGGIKRDPETLMPWVCQNHQIQVHAEKWNELWSLPFSQWFPKHSNRLSVFLWAIFGRDGDGWVESSRIVMIELAQFCGYFSHWLNLGFFSIVIIIDRDIICLYSSVLLWCGKQ